MPASPSHLQPCASSLIQAHTLIFIYKRNFKHIFIYIHDLEFSFFCVYRKHHKEMEKISLFEIITYSVVINATDSQKSGAKYMQFGRLFSS